MNTCPVCGYDKMTAPPRDYYICPCCGTEFENDDFDVSHSELRKRWAAKGMKWFSRATQRPADWNPVNQVSGVAQNEVVLSGTEASSVGVVANLLTGPVVADQFRRVSGVTLVMDGVLNTEILSLAAAL